MDRTGQRWSTEEQGLLIKFFQSGNDIEDISKALGRPQDAIVHKLIELGFLGFEESSEPPRSGFSWSMKETDDLTKEYKSRTPIDTIAAKHKRYKNAIMHKLVELRLLDISNRDALLSISQKTWVGGPSAECRSSSSRERDPYEILGVGRDATKQEVKERYIYLIKAYHPDMANSKEAKGVFEEKIKEINDAYAKIKKEKRM
jgi:DnaJ-domain-containing protein 1